MDLKPGCDAFYANATGNGEGTRFSAVTNLGMLFEVKSISAQLIRGYSPGRSRSPYI